LQNYQAITSSPVYVSPLEFPSRLQVGAEFQKYRKIYGENN